jgi:GAF domain-containing protein
MHSKGVWGLALAGGVGLVALVVTLLAVVGGLGGYVVGGALGLLAVAGALAWRGYRSVARYVVASVVFGLVVFTVTSIGSVGLTLLLLPLFIIAAGMLLSARAGLVYGVLGTLAYDAIAYVQTQQALPFAEQISTQTFLARALVGTLALLATTLLVNAGVRRWEMMAHSSARRVERLLAAVEVGLRVASHYDVDEMLNRLVILICQQFGSQYAQVFLIDNEGEHAMLRASTGDAGQRAVARGHRVVVGSMGVVGQVAAGAGPVVALDTDVDPLRGNNELLPEMRAELALPMRVGEHFVGVLDVQSSLVDAFAPEDVEALQKVADQIASAVENARALASEAGLLEEGGPARLAEHELALATDLDEVLAILRRHVALDFDRLSLVRLDRDPVGRVVPVPVAVWDRNDLAPFGVDFEHLGLDLSGGSLRIVENVTRLDEADEALKSALESLKVRSFAAFPLADPKGDAVPAGYLLVYRRAQHEFSEEQVRTFQALGGQIAVALESSRMAETISQQSERLATLGELARAISGTLNLEEVGQEFAERVGRLLSYAHLSLALLDAGGEKASLHILSADGEEYAGNRVFPLDQTAVGAVVESGETMITRDLSSSTYKDHLAWRTEDVQGAVVTPLSTRGRALGTLNLGFSGRRAPGPEDISVLEQLAAQLAIALYNAQLLEAERRRRDETAALLEIAEAMGSTLELRELLKQISIQTAQVCGVDRCSVFLLEEGTEMLQLLMSQFADSHEDLDQWERVQSAGGVHLDDAPLLKQTMRGRVPVILDDVEREDLLPREWTEPYGIMRLLSVPLVSRNRSIGVMVLDYSRPEARFSQEQIDLAMTIGSQVAASVENARLFERLQGSLAEATTLYNASLAVSSAHDIPSILESSVAQIAKLSNANRARVYVSGPDPHNDVSHLDEVILWWRDQEKTGEYQPGKRLNPADVPPLGEFPMSRSNVVLNDLAENTRLPQPTRRALRLKGVEALAMVPLTAGAAWLGAVILEKFDAQGFNEEEMRLSRSLADQAALAMNAQHLLVATRRTAAREVALREISGQLRQAQDVDSVLQVAVQELGKALGADTGSARLGGAADDGNTDGEG